MNATRTPRRVQMSRQHPWRADNPNAVIVARPGRLGNPFRVFSTKEGRKAPRWWHVTGWDYTDNYIGTEARARAIAAERFRAWIARPRLSQYDWPPRLIVQHAAIRAALASGDLANSDVACWCPLDQPCHGDVLLELANGGAA